MLSATETIIEDGVIANYILRSMAYTYKGESPNSGTGSRIIGSLYHNINLESNLLDVVERIVIPKTANFGVRGYAMVANTDRRDSVLELTARNLLKMPEVWEVRTLKTETGIKVWVVSEVINIKTRKKFCDCFAMIVEEKLGLDSTFDLRVLPIDSDEVNFIPAASTVYKR